MLPPADRASAIEDWLVVVAAQSMIQIELVLTAHHGLTENGPRFSR
jgi:hypothetical protein